MHYAVVVEGVSDIAKVQVQGTNEGEPYDFTVHQGGTETHHGVTLRYADDGWLSGEGSAPTQPPALAGICDPRGGRADPVRV